jgi:hypothetical protein
MPVSSEFGFAEEEDCTFFTRFRFDAAIWFFSSVGKSILRTDERFTVESLRTDVEAERLEFQEQFHFLSRPLL